MSSARYWAIDIHTHTPASQDVIADRYGATTPEEVVEAALAASLNAMAVTDHNTADWCDRMATAAEGTALTILPGVEISTAEGHLLAIWETGTPAKIIEEVLVRLGIAGADRGKLDIAADVGFAEAAREIDSSGGIAIAAHVERSKGLLKLQVAARVQKILMSEHLAAVEIVRLDTATEVATKVAGKRELPCLRGSDATLTGASEHVVAGLGSRRTWIKASRPDLVGLRHALGDPSLRIRLNEPIAAEYPRIVGVRFEGGFLDAQDVAFCPDLNCLLGSTGAGKSLIIESIRYALDQQVDGSRFPGIAKEVSSRLEFAIGGPGKAVIVTFEAGGRRFEAQRNYDADRTPPPIIREEVDGVWTTVTEVPSALITISAFSQGEVLEYSREPVGRMALIDASIDLSVVEADLEDTSGRLIANGEEILAATRRVADLREKVEVEAAVKARVKELTALYDEQKAEAQDNWSKDKAALDRVVTQLPTSVRPVVPKLHRPSRPSVEGSADLFEAVASSLNAFDERIERAVKDLDEAVADLTSGVTASIAAWKVRHDAFQHEVDEELTAAGKKGETLKSIRDQLAQAQNEQAEVEHHKEDLNKVASPALVKLLADREALLDELRDHRDTRRGLRRDRVKDLASKTAGIVKLDIPSHSDHTEYQAKLMALKRGSNIRDTVITAIATYVHPFKLVRAMLARDVQQLEHSDNGIDLASLAKLLAHVDERDLWSELLELQLTDQPDELRVNFKKQDGGAFVPIDQLAHGEKCTAILVMLLADGDTPIIVDQPEDALHAPWIEDHLVGRLRDLRDTRQYIFATRSPGIVVSADAEQIITLQADRGRGTIEAEGSLERYDLNQLALHHLEGGPVAFRRRSAKLSPSI